MAVSSVIPASEMTSRISQLSGAKRAKQAGSGGIHRGDRGVAARGTPQRIDASFAKLYVSAYRHLDAEVRRSALQRDAKPLTPDEAVALNELIAVKKIQLEKVRAGLAEAQRTQGDALPDSKHRAQRRLAAAEAGVKNLSQELEVLKARRKSGADQHLDTQARQAALKLAKTPTEVDRAVNADERGCRLNTVLEIGKGKNAAAVPNAERSFGTRPVASAKQRARDNQAFQRHLKDIEEQLRAPKPDARVVAACLLELDSLLDKGIDVAKQIPGTVTDWKEGFRLAEAAKRWGDELGLTPNQVDTLEKLRAAWTLQYARPLRRAETGQMDWQATRWLIQDARAQKQIAHEALKATDSEFQAYRGRDKILAASAQQKLRAAQFEFRAWDARHRKLQKAYNKEQATIEVSED